MSIQYMQRKDLFFHVLLSLNTIAPEASAAAVSPATSLHWSLRVHL